MIPKVKLFLTLIMVTHSTCGTTKNITDYLNLWNQVLIVQVYASFLCFHWQRILSKGYQIMNASEACLQEQHLKKVLQLLHSLQAASYSVHSSGLYLCALLQRSKMSWKMNEALNCWPLLNKIKFMNKE